MKALILVDIQKDFCEGGSLAVPQADEIINLVNSLQKDFEIVVATQDFHPKNHKSFASNNPGVTVGTLSLLNGQPQVMWPDHCVQGSEGVKFHDYLDMSKVVKIFPKGTNPEVDSYSGFFDNDHVNSTGMGEWLKDNNISEVVIVGLALDYCVKATALDALSLGFKTSVVVNATKAVNLNKDDGAKSQEELSNAGVKLLWI